MPSYSMMVHIKDKDVVVVGGGEVAYRKIIGLLQAGAKVTVISPDIQERLRGLWNENRFEWNQKKFEAEDLHAAFIVVAATNDKKVNQFVAQCADQNQLVNVVDHPELSTFHVPATLKRGDLTISVATGGASPTLSRVIRDDLAVVYDESYITYLQFLATVREKLKQSNLEEVTKAAYLLEITNECYRMTDEKQQEFLRLVDNLLHI